MALLAVVLLVAAGSWAFQHRGLGWGLHSGDAHEYAEMARRLSRGEGFTTGVIFPAELHLGATEAHPAVVRPPLWPLSLAALFTVFSPRGEVVNAAVLASFVATAAVAAGLATALAGPWAGLASGLAVAVSPSFGVLAVDGASETLFGLLVTLALLLLARRRSALAVGIVCGLAYLTRYNGAVLLPVAMVALAWSERRLRGALLCATGFALVAAPWWLRNAVAFGDPFYSLLSLNLYMSPEAQRANGSLLFTVEPDLASDLAMAPLAKLRANLPALLARWPLASANLAALAGVLLACVRRDRVSLAFVAVAVATTLAVAFAFPYGRYFAPLTPALLALGVAGWLRFGGRLALPALALLLVAAWLPPLPGDLDDMAIFRAAVPQLREARARDGAPARLDPDAPCFVGRPLVIAQAAARLAWEADTVAIYAPAEPAEFWRVVDGWPVAYAQLARLPVLRSPEFARRFEPRPECGADVFQLRQGS